MLVSHERLTLRYFYVRTPWLVTIESHRSRDFRQILWFPWFVPNAVIFLCFPNDFFQEIQLTQNALSDLHQSVRPFPSAPKFNRWKKSRPSSYDVAKCYKMTIGTLNWCVKTVNCHLLLCFMRWFFSDFCDFFPKNNPCFSPLIAVLFLLSLTIRPSPRPRGSARRKTASSLILRGHF